MIRQRGDFSAVSAEKSPKLGIRESGGGRDEDVDRQRSPKGIRMTWPRVRCAERY